ncbi:MAG: hypothetical protein CL961_03030 [Euryarchaeota archaeon]|nr:hypothetical protein [Euryarchaeota archaeon]
MAGLLDKAKTASNEEPKSSKKPEPKAESGTLLSQSKPTVSNDWKGSQEGGPDIPMILNLVGWAIIVIGAIISLQGGGFGFIVVLVVLALGIGLIVQSQRMSGGVSQLKTGISVALAFIIAVGPYAAIMIVPTNASMVISEVSINEDEDELSFVVRGSTSSVDAKIFAGSQEVWDGSKSLSNDRATFYIPLDSIFVGNSLDYSASVIKQYSIEVESSDGETSSIDIDTRFLTREAKNSAVSIFKIVKTTNQGSGATSVTDGISIDAAVGLFSPNEQALDDGEHTLENTALLPVASDYTFNIVIKKGSNVVYSNMPQITVNGLTATWSSPVSGSQAGDTNGWISMPGTAQNDVAEYLLKDDFYDTSGCYTFELEIVNQFYAGDTSTYTSSNSWELDWHDEDSTQDGAMTTC